MQSSAKRTGRVARGRHGNCVAQRSVLVVSQKYPYKNTLLDTSEKLCKKNPISMCYFWLQLFLGSTSSLCGFSLIFVPLWKTKHHFLTKMVYREANKTEKPYPILYILYILGLQKIASQFNSKITKIFQSLFTFTKVVYNSVRYTNRKIYPILYIYTLGSQKIISLFNFKTTKKQLFRRLQA